MHFLDNPKTYLRYDPDNLYDSIVQTGSQFDSGWHSAEFASIQLDYNKVKNVIYVGMGGSLTAGAIARSLSPFLISCPFETVSNYRLPTYANRNTLIIISSYSGNTDEAISCAEDALIRGCQTVCLTTGGRLKNISEREGISIINLDTKLNPSNCPRAGIGLSLGGTISLLLRLNPANKTHFSRNHLVQTIERLVDSTRKEKGAFDNPAKILAEKHHGSGVVFITANHLTGLSSLLQNLLNESAKTFCGAFEIPEINHHFLDGLTYPTGLKDNIRFLLINSSLFPEIIQKKVQLVKDILVKQKYLVTVIKPESQTPSLQVVESLVFLLMFSYYLSIQNKVDPSTNPWVDYLKSESKTLIS